jgi:hypothetical protein
MRTPGTGAQEFRHLLFRHHEHVASQQDDPKRRHRAKRRTPAKMSRDHAAERHPQHRAERASGHERRRERSAQASRKDAKDYCYTNAPIGRLTHTHERTRKQHFVIVGRKRATQRG